MYKFELQKTIHARKTLATTPKQQKTMQHSTATPLFDSMKKLLPISIAFLILTFTQCQTDAVSKTKGIMVKNKNETVQETINYSEYTNDTTILFVLVHQIGTDTLFVNYHPGRGTEQYSLIFKKDTIKKIFCYA